MKSGLIGCCLTAAWLFLSTTLHAQQANALSLTLPIDCIPGKDCYIQNHFDHDPGPNFRDYTCGVLGYDGHDGIDIGLPNLRRMRQGVAVLAAASGRVRAVRDSMPDISIRTPGRLAAIHHREAGNTVAIEHSDSWETQYSHLKRGSVRVHPGQTVKAGDVLGQVGLSGKTEFPHLHFSVRHLRKSVDPFTGLAPRLDCHLDGTPLWSAHTLAALPYTSTGIIQAGFTTDRPVSQKVENGEYQRSNFSTDTPAIVFWVEIFGPQKGDLETIQLLDPSNQVIAEKRFRLPRNKAKWFSYIGKKRTKQSWPEGIYHARYRLIRTAGEEKPTTVLSFQRKLEIR